MPENTDPSTRQTGLDELLIAPGHETQPMEEPEPWAAEPPSKAPLLIVVGLAFIATLAVLGWWRFSRPEAEMPPPEPSMAAALLPESDPEPPPLAEPAAAEPAVPLSLDGSDELVRGLVRGVSSHPRLASWLATDDLVRRLVAVVANVAFDEPASLHADVLRPDQEFGTAQIGDLEIIDPLSYRRFDMLTAAFVSLDPRGSAELYQRLQPLLRDAYRELGYPGDFASALQMAVAKLLATPLIANELEVEPSVVAYRFADPRLEELSDNQKLLLRMGPENQEQIQLHLRRLARAAGLDPGRSSF